MKDSSIMRISMRLLPHSPYHSHPHPSSWCAEGSITSSHHHTPNLHLMASPFSNCFTHSRISHEIARFYRQLTPHLCIYPSVIIGCGSACPSFTLLYSRLPFSVHLQKARYTVSVGDHLSSVSAYLHAAFQNDSEYSGKSVKTGLAINWVAWDSVLQEMRVVTWRSWCRLEHVYSMQRGLTRKRKWEVMWVWMVNH
jgi:hypothetical protein